MEQKQIEEGNKLLAEFMGGKLWIPKWEINEGTNREHYQIPSGNAYDPKYHVELPDKLKYHSSWDWLMPVIQKMNAIKGIEIMIKVGSVKRELLKLEIERTWLAVIQFIKWYNSLTPKP